MFSPVTTIGGGVILDIAPPRYRNRAAGAARLAALAEASPADRTAILVKESGFGISLDSLVARTGMLASEIESIASDRRFATLRQPEFWVMDADWFRSAHQDLARQIGAFHRRNPLSPGMAKQELRGNMPPFLLDALLDGGAGAIVAEGDLVRLATHKLVLREDEERARSSIESAFERAGLAVPAWAEVLAKSGVELKRARSILQILIRDGKLVRINDDLVFHQSAIETLKTLLAKRRSESFGVPAFKGVDRCKP